MSSSRSLAIMSSLWGNCPLWELVAACMLTANSQVQMLLPLWKLVGRWGSYPLPPFPADQSVNTYSWDRGFFQACSDLGLGPHCDMESWEGWNCLGLEVLFLVKEGDHSSLDVLSSGLFFPKNLQHVRYICEPVVQRTVLKWETGNINSVPSLTSELR